MKKVSLFILILILCSFSVLASNLTCQYIETFKIGENQISVLYVDGDREENFLEVKNFLNAGTSCCPLFTLYSFEVHNSLNVPVNVTLQFISDGSTQNRNTEIPAYSFVTLGNYKNIDSTTSMTYIYNSNNWSEAKWKTENIYEINCTLCGNQICLNDGNNCTDKSQCGGEYCVEGRCSNKPICYANNCDCSSVEVQCSDNTKCVKINSIPLDVKPECNRFEECISRYINPQTGLCAKSPSQIEQELYEQQKEEEALLAEQKQQEYDENQKEYERLTEELRIKTEQTKFMFYAILILIILVFLGIFLIFILKNKHENEKQKTIKINSEEKIKLINKEIEKLREESYSIKKKRKELISLKEINVQTEEERDLIKKLSIEVDEETKKHQKRLKENKEIIKEIITPKKSLILGSNVWEWGNPKYDYYPCYVYKDSDGKNINKSDILIHKEQAKKHIFNQYYDSFFKEIYFGKTFEDLRVHHIDKNFTNYRINNLAIISKEEHSKINHGNIHGDSNSGIVELKRVGIKQPHIPELNN